MSKYRTDSNNREEGPQEQGWLGHQEPLILLDRFKIRENFKFHETENQIQTQMYQFRDNDVLDSHVPIIEILCS